MEPPTIARGKKHASWIAGSLSQCAKGSCLEIHREAPAVDDEELSGCDG